MTSTGINMYPNQQVLTTDLESSKPQASFGSNAPIMTMQGQPEYDSYEGPVQEKKKSSFLGKVFKLALFAGAIIGINRLAHSKGWINPVEENAEGFMNKYIKKPLNKLDDWVVEKYNKIFHKGETAETKDESPKEETKS